jgi:hypothetical protein
VSPVAHADSSRPQAARPVTGSFRLSGDLQDGGASAQALDVAGARGSARRDPLDVTAVLVFFVVAVGLFIVPLGATLMQNEAVAAVVSSLD